MLILSLSRRLSLDKPYPYLSELIREAYPEYWGKSSKTDVFPVALSWLILGFIPAYPICSLTVFSRILPHLEVYPGYALS